MNNQSIKLKNTESINKTCPNIKFKKSLQNQQSTDNKSNVSIGYHHHKFDNLFTKKSKKQIENDISLEDTQNNQQFIELPPKIIKNNSDNNHNKHSTNQIKDDIYSSNRNKANLSPNFYQSKTNNNTNIPIRATLKNLVKGKTPQKIIINNKIINKSVFLMQQTQINEKISQSLNFQENIKQPPMKAVEKQNKILRQQNQFLKKQLDQIKKHLLFGPTNKKQQIISNLRHTIKKEDSENKQLKLKLDIINKKYMILNNLLQNKQQQIKFLMNKIQKLELDKIQQKQDYNNKIQKLKQKINYVLQCYSQLQNKCEKNNQEWESFKQKFKQEKSLYIDRITFLEDYISKHH